MNPYDDQVRMIVREVLREEIDANLRQRECRIAENSLVLRGLLQTVTANDAATHERLLDLTLRTGNLESSSIADGSMIEELEERVAALEKITGEGGETPPRRAVLEQSKADAVGNCASGQGGVAPAGTSHTSRGIDKLASETVPSPASPENTGEGSQAKESPGDEGRRTPAVDVATGRTVDSAAPSPASPSCPECGHDFARHSTYERTEEDGSRWTCTQCDHCTLTRSEVEARVAKASAPAPAGRFSVMPREQFEKLEAELAALHATNSVATQRLCEVEEIQTALGLGDDAEHGDVLAEIERLRGAASVDIDSLEFAFREKWMTEFGDSATLKSSGAAWSIVREVLRGAQDSRALDGAKEEGK